MQGANMECALQVLMGEGQSLTLELVLTDTKATRRRLIVSTVFSEAKATPLHCQVFGSRGQGAKGKLLH